MNEKTIKYIQNKIENVYPKQLEQAEQILGRVTMKYYGQLQLFDPTKPLS